MSTAETKLGEAAINLNTVVYEVQKSVDFYRLLRKRIEEFLTEWQYTPKDGEDPYKLEGIVFEVKGDDCAVYIHSDLDITFDNMGGEGVIYDLDNMNVLDVASVAEILLGYEE